jgi:hypothetical protein
MFSGMWESRTAFSTNADAPPARPEDDSDDNAKEGGHR